MPFLLRICIQWTALLCLWVIFVFQVTVSELLVGAAASALAAFALWAGLRAVPLCFQPRPRWLMQIWRLPQMIVSDLWILLKDFGQLLFRKPTRSQLEIFNLGKQRQDCRAAARRALLIGFVSTSPNSIVLDIDRKTGDVLTHKLHPQPVPAIVSKLQS